MKLLLDENFPLRLRDLLVERGIDCDHVITLGLRGTSDRELLTLVSAQELVLLTQDGDFEEMPPAAGQVVISRLWQGLPIERRVELWLAAVDVLLRDLPTQKVLEIAPSGELRPLTD
ncbi:MAG TPA: DUF5615 family PIN-like protein [Actinomycetota bacterium]|nr:DUF5615 family PIN-like protein [Actinomycetota bacterium]